MGRLFGLLITLAFTVVAAMVAAGLFAGRKVLGSGSAAGGGDMDRDSREDRARLRSAAQRYDDERRRIRDRDKARRRRMGGIRAAWIVGGVGAGLAVFGVALSFDWLHPLVGIGLGILTGAAVSWMGGTVARRTVEREEAETARPVPVVQRPMIAAPSVTPEGLPAGRAELIQKVLADAAGVLREMDTVMGRMRHPDSVASVAGIVAAGNRIMGAVAAAPEKFNTAQRLFTYYLPEAVKVAEALATLEADPRADAQRIVATQGVLQKLTMLFDRTELELKEHDAQALDIDLRLLDQSLASDLKDR
jgi:hypothetical protein